MRPAILDKQFAPVTALPGIGSQSAKLFERLAGPLVLDLVWHLPSGIVDRRSSPPIVALEPEAADKGPTRTKRPMTGEGELRAAFESAGFAGVADTMLAIRMDYANFDDFWHPMVYGQGTFGRFFDALSETRRDRLRNAVRAAYLGGESDGSRGFASVAWAVRGTA